VATIVERAWVEVDPPSSTKPGHGIIAAIWEPASASDQDKQTDRPG